MCRNPQSLKIWSHQLKKSLIENFNLCAALERLLTFVMKGLEPFSNQIFDIGMIFIPTIS